MNTPPIIWLWTMASDLEGLILIPVPSHLVVFRTSESCRSEQDEVKRTTSSANSTDRILRSPNQTPPPSIHPLGRRQLRLDMSLTSYRPCVADSHRIDKGTQRGAIHDSQSVPQDPSGHTVISLHSCKPSRPQKRMWTGWANSQAPSSTVTRVKSWSSVQRPGQKPCCSSSIRGSTIDQILLSSTWE